MKFQGEKTVYGLLFQLGNFCPFNEGLGLVAAGGHLSPYYVTQHTLRG
jgi:hypothetical protein